MTNLEKKIIKPKLGLLELAKQLGNVFQACKILGYSRDTFYRYELYPFFQTTPPSKSTNNDHFNFLT